MKVMILAAIMLHVFVLAAQDDQGVRPFGKKRDAPKRVDPNLAREKLINSLNLTDSTFALIIGKKQDTTSGILYYSTQSMLARMQSFVLANDGNGLTNFYNPSNITGYIAVFPNDTLKFISVENDLAIVSVLRKGFAQQEQYEMGTKIFLNCLVDGSCRLYKYSAGTGKGLVGTGETYDGSVNRGAFGTNSQYAGTIMFTETRYCIQKDNKRLVPLEANSIAGIFSDCKDVTDLATKETLKDERKLKLLIAKYNAWRDSSSNNQRY